MRPTQAKTDTRIDEREIRTGNGMILHAARFQSFSREFFQPQYWLSRNGAQRLGAGRGANWRVSGPWGDWVLRRYRRGGAIARISLDRYLWTGDARSRSIVEWRMLAELRRRGLPVPGPVGARVTRSGITYTAELITEFLPGTRSLGECLAAGDLDADVMDAVGRCVRRFHDSGVFHADLNAHNILLGQDGSAYLIDFDRARFRRDGRWRGANLGRLRRSLDKLSVQSGTGQFDTGDWRRLTSAYAAAHQ